jgi:hypothetical protein
MENNYDQLNVCFLHFGWSLIGILKLTVRTQLVYVVLIYLSEWLHVSAPIRPSSGHK